MDRQLNHKGSIPIHCQRIILQPFKVSDAFFMFRNWANDADDEIVDRLLEDIFAGGNLGQKNSDRGHESLLLSSQKLSVTEKSKHIIKYFNNAVYNGEVENGQMEGVGILDFKNGDFFIFKSGGDGDNGEFLMDLLDWYFENKQ